MARRLMPILGLLLILGVVGCAGSTGSSPSTVTISRVPASTTTVAPAAEVVPKVLTGHTGWVTALGWAPDGTVLGSSSGDYQTLDNTVRLWKPNGTSLAVLQSPTAPVYSVAWSPDGRIIATGAQDGVVQLRSADGTLLRTLNSVGAVYNLTWAPDGRTLATASIVRTNQNVVQWWDPQSATLLKTFTTDASGGKFYNLGWSPDGRFLVAGAIDYKLWGEDGREIAHVSPSITPAWAFAWSPDSHSWVIGNENGDAFIYDATGQQAAGFQNGEGNVDCLAWSPDGKLLAGGDGVNLWRPDGTLVQPLWPGSGRVTAVAWSPDGRWLAAGAADGTVKIWAGGMQLTETLDGHQDSIADLAWSPDGTILASASYDRTVRLWPLRR
jgi:WD40 repeat protein